MSLKNILAAAIVALTPLAASAGVYTAAVSGAPGSAVTLNVTFAGDGATVESDATFNYSNANIAITNPVVANGAQCFATATTIRIVPPSGGATPLAGAATNFCSFTVTISPAAPLGLIPFTVGSIECLDVTATNQACTLAAGAGVNVANTPVPRTLVFNPTAGTVITLGGGMLNAGGTSATSNIAVTSSGNSGTPTVSGCAITGAGASSFTVTPTSLSGFDTTPAQNLGVSCVYSAVATSATLTCNETDADSTNTPRAFPLSCPAQAVIPVNPTITAAPASGSTIALAGGIAGTQAISVVDFIATGGAGTGSTAISCTSTGNVQISNAPATPSGQGPINQTVTGSNQPADLRVGVTLTTLAQSPAGTVSCTAGAASFTYTVNAPAGTTVVPPTFIPSSSTWSTLALLSLMGVFGLLAVGFRRQS